MKKKICFERPVPRDWQRPKHLEAPVKNQKWEDQTRLGVLRSKSWPVGSVISCGFIDGNLRQHRLVEDIAHEWEEFANIRFSFSRSHSSLVRISFLADLGSWSAVGTDVYCEKIFLPEMPTMNFGWLDDSTPMIECRQVILHEFGHVLGCIHEHQSPAASLQWDVDSVYREYGGYPNYWTREKINHNILSKYPAHEIAFSNFDPDSIMLYYFDGSLLADKWPTNSNFELSSNDKQMISLLYPRAA